MYYLGIDVGGTNLVAGIVDEQYRIAAKFQAKTKVPCTPDEFADALVFTIDGVLEKAGLTLEDVPWVGIGTPGTVNSDTGVIEFANNLQFENLPLRELMEKRLDGKRVLMENDANAAAYGEYIAGALKGSKNAIAITLGTGVGGGVIIDGNVYSGSNFAGAELGHTVIVTDGKPCTCGRHGCWESYSSATGLIRITKEHLEEAPKDGEIWKLIEENDGEIDGRTSFDAMRRGDPTGQAIVDEYMKYLAVGLTNMINIFQPDILCIGGGISHEGDRLLVPIRKMIDKEQYAIHTSKKTWVCAAELGNDAGIIGAAVLGL